MTLLAQSTPADFFFPGPSKLYSNVYGLLIGWSSTANKGRAIGGAKGVLEAALPEVIMDHPGSPEACIDMLGDRTPQIIIYEEFGTFLSSSESGQLAPLREKYTDIYDCTSQSRMLVKNLKDGGKKPKRVSPRLSLLAGCATSFLEAYTLEIDWEGGFLGRFFTMNATYVDGEEKPYGEACEDEKRILVDLLKSYDENGRNTLTANAIDARCKGRTREAQIVWEEWTRNISKRAKEAPSVVQAGIARARGHAIKASMLLNWDDGTAQQGKDWYVTVEAMETAIAISELHIESIMEIAEGLAPDRDARDVRITLRSFSDTEPRTIGQALRRTSLNHRRWQEGFRTLETSGRIKVAESGSEPKFLIVRPKSNVIQLFQKEEEKGVDPFEYRGD